MTPQQQTEIIRSLLPADSKLGFVFNMVQDNCAIIFYVENHGKIVQTFFDGTSLENQSPAINAMMDDGLSTFTAPKRPNSDLMWQSFHNKFRPLQISDCDLLNIILGTAHGVEDIAIGEDVVFARSVRAMVRIQKIPRYDWEVGDSLLKTMRENPIYRPNKNKQLEFQPQNVKTLLNGLNENLRTVHSTTNSSIISYRLWQYIEENLSMAEYHTELGPLYLQIKSKCTELLTNSI